MPVKWKQGPRFKPAVVLKKIDSIRTVDSNGGASFSGFELEDCLPALHSMLDFPRVATDVDKSSLVWRGLSKVGKELTPESFLKAINLELHNVLATKEESYIMLTAISLNRLDLPKELQLAGATIRFLANYPVRFRKTRERLLIEKRVPVAPTPDSYCKVTVDVRAKSPSAAVKKALHALDLQRSVWCLMGNPQMQMSFGSASLSPINVVRLGSQHTLHLPTGQPATEGMWFEPSFESATIFRAAKPEIVKKHSRWALRKITASPYGDLLAGSLIRFVRALDEPEPSTAFLRLWGALEALTTPGQADYDKVVRRCSFLFKERAFHRQLLEHLREFRNATVHAGEESERARTHCFQLQLYFVNLIWFHLQSAQFFQTLDEANFFLDSPDDLAELQRRLKLVRKALRYAAPRES
jgi:hypothetical protein